MKRRELAGKGKRVFVAVLSAAVMMSSIAPGAVYAEEVIIEEEPGTGVSDGGAEPGMIEAYGADDGLAMQSIDGFVMSIEEVEEPNGLATSILQSRIDALPTPEEFFAMTEEMAEESTLTQQQMDIYTEAQAIADEYEALSVEEQAQVDISRLEALMEAVNEMVAVTAEEAGEILKFGGSAKVIDSSGDKTYTIKMDDTTGPMTQSALTITAESGNIVLNIAENLLINSSAPLIDIRAGEGCTVTIQGNGYMIENSREKNDGEDAWEVGGVIQVAPKNGNFKSGAKVVLNSGIYKAKTGANIKNIAGDLEINNAQIVGGFHGIENGMLMEENEGANVTINGGEVRDCDNGGILNYFESKMTIHAVKIYGNRRDGGIVNHGILNLWQESGYNIPDSDCIIQITENKSITFGGGVLVREGTVSMRGKIELTGNYNYCSDEAGLVLDYSNGSLPVKIAGSLKGSNINFVVWGIDYSGQESYIAEPVAGCLTKDYQKYNPDTAWDAYFHLKTDKEGLAQGWYTDGSGNKEVGALDHTHSWAYAQSEGAKNQTLGYLYCDNAESHCAYYGTGTNYPKENYVTLTFDSLDAENRMVYSGNPYKGASVTYKIADAIEEKVLGENKPEPKISYYTGANYTEPVTSPTNAGKYKAVVTIGETKVLEKTFTILPKELTVKWGNTSFIYNGSVQKPTATLDGVVDGDVCNVTVTGEQTSAGADYKATASIDNKNYRLRSGDETTSFEIKRASATVFDTKITNADKLSKEYDGAEVTAVESSSRSSSKPRIEYKKKTEPDSAYTATSPKDAGDYVVRVTYPQDTNYEGSFATADFTITPKAVTVTANDAKKDSGKADPQLTYRADGLAASDILSGITISRNTGEAVGTYAITVSQSAGANPNYAITFRGATFTIEPADQSSLSGKAIYNLKLPMFLAKGSGSNKKITLSWLKYKGADGYEVYWSYCDGTQGFKKLGTFKKSTLSATHKKLNNKKEYKYYVAAYKMVNGKKIYIARSNALHVAMKNAKKTNAKSITVNKEKVTIREGKTFKLKCKVKTASGRKKQLLHTDKFRYHTSDSSIATVSKSGKIKAHKKGTCTIYIFANNGVYKSVKVTVKK